MHFLASCGPGKLVDEAVSPGPLEVGRHGVGEAVLVALGGGEPGSGRLHVGHHRLAPAVVGERDDDGVGDRGVR